MTKKKTKKRTNTKYNNAQKEFSAEIKRVKKLLCKHVGSHEGICASIAFLHQMEHLKKVILRGLPGPVGSLLGLGLAVIDFEERKKHEARS